MTAKILIVDDEPFNLEIIGEYFDGQGHELAFFEDGETAWAALKAADSGYDLAIIDRMMPGLDGLSLLKRIKSDVRLAALPVIMQTAAASPEHLNEGLQAGAYYYLIKPYERESLQSIARAALSDAAAKAELRHRLREHSDSLLLLEEGFFSLSTLEEAQRLASFLAQASAQPDTVVLGLSELLINAVEHGNLGITYEEKSELKRLDRWQEEVGRRAALPENANKRVRVLFRREPERLMVRIADEGRGFDWKNYLDFSPERAFDPNGRGIALARLSSFETLAYQDGGSTVEVTIRHESHHLIPN